MATFETKLAFATVFACALGNAQAADPQFTSFDVPGATVGSLYISGINSDGTVVGNFTTADGSQVGLIRAPSGRLTAPIIDPANPAFTFLRSINDEGTIAGYDCDAVTCHGFTLDDGHFTMRDMPGAFLTFVFAINNRGDLAGTFYSADPNDPGTGFIAPRRGDPIVFPSPKPATLNFLVESVNDQRAAAGYGFISAGLNIEVFGFLRRPDGAFVDVAFPGATQTRVFGVNDCGIVVGAYFIAPLQQHGFYGRPGALKTLDVPLARVSYPYGISNDGRIVGAYFDTAAVDHGFVTAPIDEAACD